MARSSSAADAIAGVIDVIEPTPAIGRSIGRSQCPSLSRVEEEVRNTISRNMPPKAAIVALASLEVLRVELLAR